MKVSIFLYLKPAVAPATWYNYKIRPEEIENVVEKLKHIIERLFIRYFSSKQHIWGSEIEIVSLMSLLPLKHRIYILSNIPSKYVTPMLVDKLSLAYAKNQQGFEAVALLNKHYKNRKIEKDFYLYQLSAITKFVNDPMPLEDWTKDIIGKEELFSYLRFYGAQYKYQVVSPAQNTFDTAENYKQLESVFAEDYKKYPEIFDMFYCLINFNGSSKLNINS